MNQSNKRVVFYSLIASLGGLLFGFDIAIFSGAIPFIQPDLDLSPSQLGWVASSLYLGCAAGTMTFGKIAERLGRKKSLFIVALIFGISSIAMGLSNHMNTIVIWRVIAGFSVGGASILSPLYIAELSPRHIRGKMVSINQLAIVIGILMAYITNYYLSFTSWNWRLMFMSGALPATLFLIFLPFLPESPKWLLFNGQREKGAKILGSLLTEDQLQDEINHIDQQKEQEQKGFAVATIFKQGFGFLLLVAIVIAVCQQFSGANAVLFYAPIIFEKAGMDVSGQLFQQILIGSINLIATLIGMRFVDKVGRKRLLLIGSGGMALLLVLIGLSFSGTFIPSYLLSFCVIAFIGVYAATLGPVTWVVITEIFPMQIRETAVGIASAFLWVACFSLTYLFPVIIDTFTTLQTFLLFAGICFAYFIFILSAVRETKNNRV